MGKDTERVADTRGSSQPVAPTTEASRRKLSPETADPSQRLWTLAASSGLDYLDELLALLISAEPESAQKAFVWYLSSAREDATQLLMHQSRRAPRAQQSRVQAHSQHLDTAQAQTQARLHALHLPTVTSRVDDSKHDARGDEHPSSSEAQPTPHAPTPLDSTEFEARSVAPGSHPVLTALGAGRVVGRWIVTPQGQRIAALGLVDHHSTPEQIWQLLRPHAQRVSHELRALHMLGSANATPHTLSNVEFAGLSGKAPPRESEPQGPAEAAKASPANDTTSSEPKGQSDGETISDSASSASLMQKILPVHSNATSSALVGSLAHEFNNILMSIMGYASLARRDFDEGLDLTAHLKEIEKAGNRTAKLVKQLRTYTRALDQKDQTCHVEQLLEELLALMLHSPNKGVKIQSEVAPGLPTVAVSPANLRHVIIALLNNAREAYSPRKVPVRGPNRMGQRAKPQIIHVRSELSHWAPAQADHDHDHVWQIEPARPHNSAYVLIEVFDEGRGMSREQVEQIFDPNFSTKSTTRGLGMAVVREIITRVEGALRIESSVDKGTRVSLLLPTEKSPTRATQAGDKAAPEVLERPAPAREIIERSPPRDARRGAAPPERGHGQRHNQQRFSELVDTRVTRFTVLVMEHDGRIRDAIHTQLHNLGIGVFAYGDLREGLGGYEAHRNTIDCLILDVDTPGGIEASEIFRYVREVNPSIFTIALARHALAQSAFPPDLLINHPFDMAHLDGALGFMLQQRSARRSAGPRATLSGIEFNADHRED